MLLMCQSLERLLVTRDALIFLTNLKKSVMEPVQTVIFRPCDKFDLNDSFFNGKESKMNFTGMKNNIFNERDNGFAVKTISRSSIIHHTSSSSSSDSIWLPTSLTSVSPYKEKIILSDKHWEKNCSGG